MGNYIPAFHDLIYSGFAGPGQVESVYEVMKARPLYDDFWEAKRIPIENIDNIPMYLLASYSSQLHTHGSFSIWRESKTKQKWLRVHPYQEWHDQYRPEILDDLQKFFDRYCKDIDNGWERDTPPVRLSLLGFESDGSPCKTVIERPELQYPLAREKECRLFLDAANTTMSPSAPEREAEARYHGHSLDSELGFQMFFNDYTEIAGYSKLTLHISCSQKSDMDIVVQLRKTDFTGRPLVHLNFPCPVPLEKVPNVNTAKCLGPQGFLRASHTVSLDNSRSVGNDLFYTHRIKQPIEKGDVVKLEIAIWPMGMCFAPGEGIMLKVSGHNMCLPETPEMEVKEAEDENEGVHVVYTGPEHLSCLSLPIVCGGGVREK